MKLLREELDYRVHDGDQFAIVFNGGVIAIVVDREHAATVRAALAGSNGAMRLYEVFRVAEPLK